MKGIVDAVLIRVFTCEAARFDGKPLYEVIVHKAKELNMAGVTVLRGIYGYGVQHKIHSAKLLELSEDLPLIVEIVDTEENINKIIPFLEESVEKGLVTFEGLKMLKR